MAQQFHPQLTPEDVADLRSNFTRAEIELKFAPYKDFDKEAGTHNFTRALTHYIIGHDDCAGALRHVRPDLSYKRFDLHMKLDLALLHKTGSVSSDLGIWRDWTFKDMARFCNEEMVEENRF